MTIPNIYPCEVPPNSLLSGYNGDAGYADCYQVEVSGLITQAIFIEAFYTSPLFKIERGILTHLARKPASDADVRRLAIGQAVRFSAWHVEAQTSAELLLSDFTGRTRSWLMAIPSTENKPQLTTLLYFGSAVVARSIEVAHKPKNGLGFSCVVRLSSPLFSVAACCSQQTCAEYVAGRERLKFNRQRRWKLMLLAEQLTQATICKSHCCHFSKTY
ncbi:MAG: hypothetical protein IPJ25_06005 [Rhodocyclaceae bacterium]|nr:hypothetical protein [Rhodocyclaceae bacterium]